MLQSRTQSGSTGRDVMTRSLRCLHDLDAPSTC